MKNKKLYAIAFTLLIVIAISSCKKDPTETITTPTPVQTGSLKIELENTVGDSALVLNTSSYTNANNDTFTVSTFKYYISNIKLKKADNTEYTVPESYFLIDHSVDASNLISLANIPVGDYTGITFMIGVDSIRNVSGAQTGALDPANGMFWSWLSGYIMFKMEGNSPQSSTTEHKLVFHVGGFSGTNNVLKTITPSFNGSKAIVSTTVTPEIHLKVDLLEAFTSPDDISFSSINTIHMPGANAKMLADNYADMFSVEHIHN